MLENSLFESQGRKKTRKPVTVAIAAFAHVVTIVVLVVIPLLQTQALTLPHVDMSLLLPRIDRPRIVEAFVPQQTTRQTRSQAAAPSAFTTPISIPTTIMRDIGEPTIPDVQFLPTGDGPGISRFIESFGPHTEISTPGPPPVPPPALPPPPKPVDTHPIRTSSGTQAAKLIYQVKPEYPQLAKITRTQGVVVLEALIRRDGSIDSLRVVSGHQLLTQAALDAVKQWKYQPTLLNGEPVEVVTTITVTFTLQ